MPNSTPLFALGQVNLTQGALQLLEEGHEDLLSYLHRHVTGDWAEMDAADQAENRLSVAQGFRIFSAYRLKSGAKIWIITEADRRMTTCLRPDEY